MLTKEVIKSNAVLAGLTEGQLTAIETLSRNDENTVIGAKVKEIHDQYDADIKAITGVDKPDNVKSYDHLKTQLTNLKSKADASGSIDTLKTENENLKAEKAKLEEQIAKGSNDEALKSKVISLEQQIKDKDNLISQQKTTHETEVNDLTKKFNEEKSRNTSLQVSSSIDAYAKENKIAYKTTIPEGMRNRMFTTERDLFLSEVSPDYIDDGEGGQRMVFRDKQGTILRNKSNGLEPFTAGELFFNRDGIKDMIDAGKKQPGGGTKDGDGTGRKTPANLDLSSAKTQVQADEMIMSHLMENEGLTKTDPKFYERQKEIRTESGVADLPIREGESA